MAWTAIIGPEEAQGELKELYDALEARGITLTAEFLGVYTQEPGILRWLTAGLKPGYGATAIETALTQMIATVVSVVNGCGNCTAIHGALMRRMLGTTLSRTRSSRTTPRRPWSPRSGPPSTTPSRSPASLDTSRRPTCSGCGGQATRTSRSSTWPTWPRGSTTSTASPWGWAPSCGPRPGRAPEAEASVYSASLVVIAAVGVMVLLWLGFMAWAHLSGQMRESERAKRLPLEDEESSTNGEAHV